MLWQIASSAAFAVVYSSAVIVWNEVEDMWEHLHLPTSRTHQSSEAEIRIQQQTANILDVWKAKRLISNSCNAETGGQRDLFNCSLSISVCNMSGLNWWLHIGAEHHNYAPGEQFRDWIPRLRTFTEKERTDSLVRWCSSTTAASIFDTERNHLFAIELLIEIQWRSQMKQYPIKNNWSMSLGAPLMSLSVLQMNS